MKLAIKCLLGAMLFSTFGAMAQTTPISDKKLNILTLGDSNGTFPYSWPIQIKNALPNSEVYNISKSGRTIGFVNLNDTTLNSLMMIDGNLKNAAEHTGDKPYDFIVMELGTNDGKAVFANQQAEVPANMEKLIQKIKGSKYSVISKAKILIISPPPYGTKAETTEKYAGGLQRMKNYSEAFQKIAKKNGCLFVNGFVTPGLDVETMTVDGLHLNATGSRKLIEPVVAAMIK